MCSNNCGRYVCAVHAMPRKGPGSAMICLSCAEALGLLDKPKSQPVVTPIIPIFNPPAAGSGFDPGATQAGARPIAKPAPAQSRPPVTPTEEHSPATRRLADPPLPPQASETIVSQRGNTLQVPRVTAAMPRSPQSTGGMPPRPAKRADETLARVDRQLVIMAAGSVALGIIGFVMILLAVRGG
jgi:hypothetical protein